MTHDIRNSVQHIVSVMTGQWSEKCHPVVLLIRVFKEENGDTDIGSFCNIERCLFE
jgi:hypothetical protein